MYSPYVFAMDFRLANQYSVAEPFEFPHFADEYCHNNIVHTEHNIG